MNRQEVFDWVRGEYGTEPDYPWNDNNAVLRHDSIVNGTVLCKVSRRIKSVCRAMKGLIF